MYTDGVKLEGSLKTWTVTQQVRSSCKTGEERSAEGARPHSYVCGPLGTYNELGVF